MQKWKEKVGKRIQSAKKKSERSKEVHMSIKRSKEVYIYQKKDLSLEVNTAILEAFWISQLRKLNLLSDT